MVVGLWLAAQVSHCWHHLAMYLLNCSQNCCLILSNVPLTTCHKGLPWSSINTSLPLLCKRTLWAVLVPPSPGSYWHSSMSSVNTRNFHWSHKLLFVPWQWPALYTSSISGSFITSCDTPCLRSCTFSRNTCHFSSISLMYASWNFLVHPHRL